MRNDEGDTTLCSLLALDYAALRGWIGDHIARTYLSSKTLTSDARARVAASAAIARRFERFGRRSAHKNNFRCRTALEHVLGDIFLTSRLGDLNASFLHLQEGSTADFRARHLGSAELALNLLSRRLGRRALPGMSISLRWRGAELWSANIDPFPHLRTLYAVKIVGTGSRAATLDLLAFKLKALVLEQVMRAAMKKLSRGPSALELVRLPIFRSAIMAVLELHAESSDAKTAAEVAAGVAPFVSDFGARLLRQFGADGGALAKFLKMIVAVVVWRATSYQHKSELSEYVIDTIRLSLAWASTYPLVDDVLDSRRTTGEERVAVGEIIAGFVSCQSSIAPSSSGSALLHEAFEIIAQARTIDAVRTRRAVKLVADAHILESAKLLETGAHSLADELEVYADTFLKSFLVRVATMVLCGVEPSPSDLAHGMEVALFNQLGDDLIDIDEDMDERRVTPFTLFHTQNTCLNPYDVYLTCVRNLASTALGVPAVYSCFETLATAWERQPAEVRCFVRPHLQSIAQALAWGQDLDDPAGIFYIDPDTILVRGVEALIALTPATRQ